MNELHRRAAHAESRVHRILDDAAGVRERRFNLTRSIVGTVVLSDLGGQVLGSRHGHAADVAEPGGVLIFSKAEGIGIGGGSTELLEQLIKGVGEHWPESSSPEAGPRGRPMVTHQYLPRRAPRKKRPCASLPIWRDIAPLQDTRSNFENNPPKSGPKPRF